MSLLAIGIVFCSTFLHAGWNLMVRDQRHTEVFIRTLFLISALGLAPALAAEVWGTPVAASVAGYLIVAGTFQAIYYLGLKFGYRNGEFTVVYPLARSLPVMALALLDMLLGRTPSPLGWLGVVLVSLGCLLVPLRSWRELRLANYLNHGVGWALVTAVGMVGYSLTDSAAAHVLPSGPTAALQYGFWEMLAALIAYWPITRLVRSESRAPLAWRTAGVVAALTFGAYAMVLWAYQLSTFTSYVVAMRQLSIVIGVVAGGLLFREAPPRLRLAAVAMIVLGTACIALAR